MLPILAGCCSVLQEKIPEFLGLWNSYYPDTEPRIIQAVRSPAYQHELWCKGRTSVGPGVDTTHPLGRKVTNADGYLTLSNHQTQVKHGELAGHAVDIGLYRDGKYLDGLTPETLDPYHGFLRIADEIGLRSGWTFPRADPDHLECFVVPAPVAPVTT
jgi:hypothetical protein